MLKAAAVLALASTAGANSLNNPCAHALSPRHHRPTPPEHPPASSSFRHRLHTQPRQGGDTSATDRRTF